MSQYKVGCSFWGFGIINNLLYVVILSAAIDLVGNSPKGTVLLADVLPSLLFKLTAPFYFQKIPYTARIVLLMTLSFFGMQIIANSSSITLKLTGIVMASLSSGIGEVTFLQMTHYYGSTAINAWSSGTGASGLVGSFVFMAATSWMRVSTPLTLKLFSIVPFVMIILYKYALPQSTINSSSPGPEIEEALPLTDSNSSIHSYEDSSSMHDTYSKIRRLRSLLVPFILPLMTVYTAEYIINQGISPTLLFDLLDMPMFRNYRDAYVMYGTLYQVGVFISRSSGAIVRIRKLWLMATLQTINVFLAIMQSIYMFNSSIYITFVFMVFEGLLGGAAYINTFMLVSEAIPKHEREFSLGAVTMSDSSGVVIAALISMWIEPALCSYQVHDGRPWCELAQ